MNMFENYATRTPP